MDVGVFGLGRGPRRLRVGLLVHAIGRATINRDGVHGRASPTPSTVPIVEISRDEAQAAHVFVRCKWLTHEILGF